MVKSFLANRLIVYWCDSTGCMHNFFKNINVDLGMYSHTVFCFIYLQTYFIIWDDLLNLKISFFFLILKEGVVEINIFRFET